MNEHAGEGQREAGDGCGNSAAPSPSIGDPKGPRHVIASCIVDTLHNQANTADSPLFVSEAALEFVVVAAGGVEIVRAEEEQEREEREVVVVVVVLVVVVV